MRRGIVVTSAPVYCGRRWEGVIARHTPITEHTVNYRLGLALILQHRHAGHRAAQLQRQVSHCYLPCTLSGFICLTKMYIYVDIAE